jgi:arginase
MLPLVLGGDHSPAVGSVTASAQHWQDLGLVWIDAHPDFNTPETSPSGNAHGMVLAALAGLVPTDFVIHSTGGSETGSDRPVISPERIVVLGIRSVDEGEQQLLQRSRLKVYPWRSIQRRGVADTLADALAYLRQRGVARVHMSVDLDVLDPGGWPGVSTPAPGGPDLKALTDFVGAVAGGIQVIAIDIVELNPERDQSGRTAEAAIQIAESALQGPSGGRGPGFLP